MTGEGAAARRVGGTPPEAGRGGDQAAAAAPAGGSTGTSSLHPRSTQNCGACFCIVPITVCGVRCCDSSSGEHAPLQGTAFQTAPRPMHPREVLKRESRTRDLVTPQVAADSAVTPPTSSEGAKWCRHRRSHRIYCCHRFLSKESSDTTGVLGNDIRIKH